VGSGRRRLCALLLVAAGCERPGATSSIGAGGGTISIPGVTLSIPAGALAAPQLIRVTRLSTVVDGYHMSTALFRFEPEGLVLAQPATVALHCDQDCAPASMYWSRPDAPGYDALSTQLTDGALVAAVVHFSTGFGGTPAAPDLGTSTSDDLSVVDDLSVSNDLSIGNDLSMSPSDLAMSADFAGDDLSVNLCKDGIQDGLETDVDCGGPVCFPCLDGKKCLVSSDCASYTCSAALICVEPPSCVDGIKNQDETDIDCGGSICPACANGKMCLVAHDCQSGYCSPSLVCALAPPTDASTDAFPTNPLCFDGILDNYETDVDCGGLWPSPGRSPSGCGPCANGKKCVLDQDCSSGWCDTRTNTCAPITCVAPKFTAAGPAPTGFVPGVTADFNVDGKLDLVVTTPSTFGIAFGRGDGTFAPPATYSALTTAGVGFQVAEWEGDATPDLLLLWSDHAQPLLGAGDGTFKRGASVPVPVEPNPPHFGTFVGWLNGDFNGDHKGDLIAVGQYANVTFLGNGDGTFGTPSWPVPSPYYYTVYAVGAIETPPGGGYAISYNGIAGHEVAFSAATMKINLLYGPLTYLLHAPGDLDGDGLGDLIITANVELIHNTLDEVWGVAGVIATTRATSSLTEIPATEGFNGVAGDFNGDGKVDLIGNGLLCGNGDGSFQAPIPISITINPLVQGDFNHDGKNDFIDQSGVVQLNAN
jgi:hypothetical protein